MPSIAEVQDVLQDSVQELHDRANDNDATPGQRKAARAALNDLLLQQGAQSIQTIEGRTAVLAAVLAELEEVIASIRGAGAVSGALDRITSILGDARRLYDAAKKELRDA